MKPIYAVLICLLTGMQVFAQTPLKSRDSTIKGPQTFAMIVGISKYRYVRPLTYADKDAELFRDYLKSPGGGNVKDENIFCLLNEQALNSSFWGKGFQWLKAKRLQAGDKLFIYLAGHGDAIDEDQFFFLAYDCNPGGDKNNYLVSGAIQLFNLKKKIANETARGVEVIFIMDACRSNELPGGTAGQNFLNTAITEKQAGEIIMLATGAGQESLEDASIGNGHGLFTYYLIEGLNGLADSLDTPDQRISFREIQSYVNKNVPPVAAQRFNRKQEPYFCCTANSEKIISSVDTAYLGRWLKLKRSQQRGPGNSFYENPYEGARDEMADTLLVETYNRFYQAVRNNHLNGVASAEDYFQQLNQKFPGNPYTLDAKSTLAVEYVNVAQALVNDYLGCNELAGSASSTYQIAGNNLEKAIKLLREDDLDFANSLLGRMYLLKASGNQGNTAPGFQFAHAARAIDPGGAYIMNRLATLHMENNNYDSALFYAEKAASLAPNWNCALTTLAKARQQQASSNRLPVNNANNKVAKTPKFGVMLGSGFTKPVIEFSPADWRQGNIDYNDSLATITTNGAVKFDAGISCYIPLSEQLAIRPAAHLTFEKSELIYHRREVTGGPIFLEPVENEHTTINLPLAFIYKLTRKNTTPWISLAPMLSLALQDKNDASVRLPVKSPAFMGEGAVGWDISLLGAKIVISPELRYTHGFSDTKGERNNLYLNTISSLKKQSYSFSVHIRKL